MSFQTFCGQDPDDAVSYQKVLPRFLPENSSSSVIRIEQTGSAIIPAPTINNESLYVIDTAGINANFTYNQISIPSGYRTIAGITPYVNPADNTKINYFAFCYKFVSDNPETYAYSLMRLADPTAGWAEVFSTDDNKTINAICNVNPHYVDGGKPLLADTFLIVGNFTQLGATACPSGYAIYDPQNNTITPYPIATPMPNPADLPTNIIPLPAQYGGGFMASFQDPANHNRIARLAAGVWAEIAPNTGLINTDKNNILTLCFDEPNGILYIGGYFTGFDVNGVLAPNSQAIVALAYDNGTNDWRTNVPLPNIQPLYAYNAECGVEEITLAYSSVGIFVIGDFQNATATAAFFSRSIATQIVPIAIPQTLINVSGNHLIGIDASNYVGSNQQRMFGQDGASGVLEFGSGVVSGLTWYWDAPIATYPLSYMGDVAYGGFQQGTETTLDFTAANLRYCKDSGVSGLATQVVLTSNYASIFLMGDTKSTPPVWDMVSYTGILKYTP